MARRLLAVVWVAASVALAAAGQAAAAGMETTVNVTPDGIAIDGWDTVAYFTEDGAVRGVPEFSHEWDGATWLFSSAANRDLFASNPEAYAPEFGGWCAYALSQGRYAAEVEPGHRLDRTRRATLPQLERERARALAGQRPHQRHPCWRAATGSSSWKTSSRATQATAAMPNSPWNAP